MGDPSLSWQESQWRLGWDDPLAPSGGEERRRLSYNYDLQSKTPLPPRCNNRNNQAVEQDEKNVQLPGVSRSFASSLTSSGGGVCSHRQPSDHPTLHQICPSLTWS